MSTGTFNSDGPECPRCGHVIEPDESHHYDTLTYTEDECPNCGQQFSVEVITSVDWRCCPIEAKEAAKREKTKS